jgi:hypothetical protein
MKMSCWPCSVHKVKCNFDPNSHSILQDENDSCFTVCCLCWSGSHYVVRNHCQEANETHCGRYLGMCLLLMST